MVKSLSKKARKVIEENLVEFMQVPSLIEMTKIGAILAGIKLSNLQRVAA